MPAEWLRRHRTQDGSPRTIPMNESVTRAYARPKRARQRAGRDHLVFSIKSLRLWFLSALSKTKIEHHRRHDNRHTFTSDTEVRSRASAVSIAQWEESE